MLIRVLVAADAAPLRKRMQRLLKDQDVDVDAPVIRSGSALHDSIRSTYDMVLVSRSLLGTRESDSVQRLQSQAEAPEVVAFCQQEDLQDQARLLAAGCRSVLFLGLDDEMLSEAIRQLLDDRREKLRQTLATRRGSKPSLADFVSQSPAMQAFISVVRRVVNSDASLLITGETGVGKERLARAIHAESRRTAGPFVAVNCGALPDTLLESELFGHEEGAFTGASRARRGWFELAHGGTIFLDEIGEMPPHLQVKLLHVLQNHEVQRLGSERSLAVNVRVIAATNRELAADMESGSFRKDLFYRLGVVTLTIPPLRNRKEDIPSLVDDYISHFRAQIAHDVSGVSEAALQALVDYAWPGNVRELINVIERAMLLCEEGRITLEDLPDGIRREPRPAAALLEGIVANGTSVPAGWLNRPLKDVRADAIEEVERNYLRALLEHTGGKIGATARQAGLEPRSLYEKMRRYGLRKEDFRPSRKGSD